MKRRRRGGAAPPAGACGVWLDTAELKLSAAQSLIAKTNARCQILESKRAWDTFTQPRDAQLRTRQTSISAFFSAQTGEKDKENSSPSPFTPNEDCKEKGISSAASPVKILALSRMEKAQKRSGRAEEEQVLVPPQRCAQEAPALPNASPDSWLSQAESHSESEAGEDSCCFSFSQDSEGNRVIAHRKASDLLAGEMVSASSSGISACRTRKHTGQPHPENTGLDLQPRLGTNQSKKPRQSCSVSRDSLIDFTENINPAVRRDGPWAAAFGSSPGSTAGVWPLRERSHNASAGPAERWGRTGAPSGPCGQLFTQDSQGNRVIAHRNVPSPRRDRDSDGSGRHPPRSPCKGLGEQQLDECYDLLFTQDSQGNRVIKHW
ncbi:aurora kinase A- and ninein-interacting protein [Caloenas nicobarica]|uniref:aurora kinase A- and ninein-interacting protein n=1 Tax=Caloenas nicobarica TaxID=187106 RepID=UPI0032B76259